MTRANGLPDGWTETTLSTIRVDRSTSIDPSKHTTEAFELYSIPAYPTGRPEVVTGSEVGSTKKSLEPGTVVVSKINPRINRVWVVAERNNHRQIGSSEWIPFFPLAGVDSHYLAYFMQQDEFRNYLAANVSGVGGSLMRVKPSTVDPYPFVVAPLPEQQRIVSAIESYFTRLDDAVATLERVQCNLKRYRASVLKAAVEGRLVPTEAELARAEGRSYEPASVLLTHILAERRRRWEEAELAKMTGKGKAPNDDKWKAKYKEPVAPDTSKLSELPEGWCWVSTDQVFWFVTSGSRGWAKYYSDSGAAFIRIGNLDHDSISLDLADIQHVLPPDGAEGTRTRIAPGDVLVSITADVGMIALVGDEIEEAYINQHVSLARPVRCLSLSYLAWFLAAQHGGQRQFSALQRGATKVGLGLDDIRGVNVPLPPLGEQVRIVEEIERCLSIATACEDSIAMNTTRLQRARQSILKWAFEGRLVDQAPTDEPASVLIERIRAERDGATRAPTNKRRRARKNGAQ